MLACFFSRRTFCSLYLSLRGIVYRIFKTFLLAGFSFFITCKSKCFSGLFWSVSRLVNLVNKAMNFDKTMNARFELGSVTCWRWYVFFINVQFSSCISCSSDNYWYIVQHTHNTIQVCPLWRHNSWNSCNNILYFFFGGGGVCGGWGGRVLKKMNGLKTFSNTVPRLNQIAEFVNWPLTLEKLLYAFLLLCHLAILEVFININFAYH